MMDDLLEPAKRAHESEPDACGLDPWLRLYLTGLVVLLPIDFFRPTANLLRELGARPAILWMLCGSAWLVGHRWRFYLLHAPESWIQILRAFFLIGVLGSAAFLINLLIGISYTDGARSPYGQFLGQILLFCCVPLVLLSHAELFARKGVLRYLISRIPFALAVHLFAVALEGANLLNAMRFPLDQFRPESTIEGKRASGLMTEPSYLGVLTGIYAPVCVFSPSSSRTVRICKHLLAGVSIGACLFLGAKTIVPVLGAAMAGYVIQRRLSLKHPVVIAALVVLAALGLYNILTFSALDVRDNLSSAMRLGSSVLAWNVAKAGYGVLGVGFGQFHFLYNVRFAPWYLTYSEEANLAFSRFGDTRASTYNLFLRYLVETGITGLSLFFYILWKMMRIARSVAGFDSSFGALMLCGSLGFLATQDPYFFPMFVTGGAVLMSLQPPAGVATSHA